jgi:DNA-binding response OmpR family regulator
MQDKIKILIVEDEKPLLEAISIKLKSEGFDILTAREAETALDILKKDGIRAIWLDHYLLGKENGLDLVAKIKTDENYRQIPIFIVSNTVSLEKIRTYMQLGVEKYYIKANYRLENIISDIKHCLEGGNQE